MASVACNLLAALHRDPAWRSLCSVVRLAEHACPARGASWLAARRPRGGGKARLVACCNLLCAHSGQLCRLRSAVNCQRGMSRPDRGRPAASFRRQWSWHFPFEREYDRVRLRPDMHTHAWVTGPTVQLRPHVTRNRQIATCGQRYNRIACVRHRPKRAERAVSALCGPSGPIASGGAPAPATRWPHAVGGAIRARRASIARPPLGALRRLPERSCWCTKPAKRISKCCA